MVLSQRLDPHTTCVVDVPCDHADRTTWRSRYWCIPKLIWQMLDEKNVDAIVSSPRVEQHLFLIGIGHRESHNQNLAELKRANPDEYLLDTASWEIAEE